MPHNNKYSSLDGWWFGFLLAGKELRNVRVLVPRQITKDQGWRTNTSFFKVTNNQYSDRPCWSKNCWTTCWLLSGWYTSLLVVLFQKITESVGGWKVIELYAEKRRLKLNYQYSSLKKKCLKCYCKCGEVWNAVINMSSTCHLFYPLKMLGAND